jgi:hypothetical protein
MPMTKILEQALREAEKLPEADQQIIADFIIHFTHPDEKEEAEWDALVQSPESQRFLDAMAEKVRQKKARGELLEFDPGDA